MIRLNDAQHRRVKKLTRCHCANNVRGCCLLLDDGEPCVCVQAISYSLICRYFREAVLPADRVGDDNPPVILISFWKIRITWIPSA